MSRDAVAGLVGATFGLVFVLVNAGPLPTPYDVAVRALGVVLYVGVAVLLVRAGNEAGNGAGNRAGSAEVGPRAVRTYWTTVALEVVLLLGGATLLGRTGHSGLSLPWVVCVVGLHFVPFASAFGAPFYLRLAGILVTLGVTGAVLALSGVDPAWVSLVSGVGAGLALLGFAIRPATRTHHATSARGDRP